MPPKKSKMSPHINKTPTLTPSRRSPRVPAPQKCTDESSQPSKTLNITSASPQDNSINIRFYSSKTTPTSPKSPENPPETSSSRRRTFQSRPSRLSTVYTPTVETPATNQNSRRTRRTAALETPKNEGSDIDLPDSIDRTGWTYDQYMGSFESEGTADGLSSPTSASDMRNSSRVRKPTMRAIESFETVKKKPRRKNTSIPTPTVEKPDPLGAKVAKNNVAKTNVSKKPIIKTRTSRRMANSNMQKNFVLLGFDIDTEVVGKALFDLTFEALSPGFALPSNYPDFYNKARDQYHRRQQDEKYGADLPADTSAASDDVDMANEDLSAVPDISLPSPIPAAVPTKDAGILGYEKQSESKIADDGWVETGRINNKGEEVSLIPDQYHPYYLSHTYGYEGLPYPPVRARSGQQADADYSHGFPPFMGGRNLPSDGVAPFITENVKEEQARVFANAPAPAPATKSKKPRARKRRQTAAADAADTKADETTTTTTPATDGARKSQRRRRQTAPAPTARSSSSPSSPPTTATKVRSSGPAAAVTTAATEDDKPKVQRLRLTLKPEPKTETSGVASVSAEAPAVQSSPSSPAPSHAPTPASTNKRRRRRG